MKNTLFLLSNHNNNYFFNYSTNSISLIHPLIKLFHEEINKTGKIDKNNYQQDFSKEMIEYYREKYFFFKKHKLIDTNISEIKLVPDISSLQVERQVANLTQLTLEITEQCNYDCTYCAYGELYNDYGEREREHLSFEKIEIFLKKLVKLKKSNINSNNKRVLYISFYGGEPLLNIELIKEVVSFINKAKLEDIIKYSITTNGWYLDKYLDFLIENDFNILLSLDGDVKTNKYRVLHNRKETYSKVFNSAKKIMNKHPLFFENNVNFNSVFSDAGNQNEINAFFEREFDKKTRISTISNSGVTKNKVGMFNEMFKTLKIEKEIKYIPENSRFLNLTKFLRFTLKLEKKSIKSLFNNSTPKHNPTGTCFPFSKKMFITAQGKVLPCERIGHQYELGNVVSSKTNFISYSQIANQYETHFNKMIKLCSNCYRKNDCSQCMFYLNVSNNEKVKCPHFASEIVYTKDLEYYLNEIEENPDSIIESFNKIIVE